MGWVTPAAYNQMTAAASISRGLYEYGPFLMQLQDCTFVRETISSISVNNCPGLRHYSGIVYDGLVVMSASVMLSIVCWMAPLITIAANVGVNGAIFIVKLLEEGCSKDVKAEVHTFEV
ncbi:hypothetical protein ZWY2020_003980 [Hordeum vulgare]|nr:hypothetical protein ZWY2020_003980 [Hordeum vulgare]